MKHPAPLEASVVTFKPPEMVMAGCARRIYLAAGLKRPFHGHDSNMTRKFSERSG